MLGPGSSSRAPDDAATLSPSTASGSYTAADGSRQPRVSLTPSRSIKPIVLVPMSSPPTPAPSPRLSMPGPEPSFPVVSTASDSALAWASLAPIHLRHLPPPAVTTLLSIIIPHLNSAQLMHVASLLPARVKRDFLADLPPELALHILSFVDDIKTLARASQVSRMWHFLVEDETPWRIMSARRGFEIEEDDDEMGVRARMNHRRADPPTIYDTGSDTDTLLGRRGPRDGSSQPSAASSDSNSRKGKQQIARRPRAPIPQSPFSYRKHFKTAHLTEYNWRHSGRLLRSHRSQDAGVVTSLALDAQWIVVGLANSRVHVFSASTGVLARTLVGHEAGVWSLWLVSRGGRGSGSSPAGAQSSDFIPETGSDDSWASLLPQSFRTGIGLPSSSASSSSSSSGEMPFQSVFDSLRPDSESEGSSGGADTSARQSDPCNASRGWGQANALVISGGCDKQIRVWDVKSGYCLYVLRGHRSTIRCMKVFHGRPIAVSGSRDHTLRVWDVQKGTLLRTLEGHTDSVRCLDVFGDKVVSGSYDCTVRLWDVNTGECLRVFNGHYHQVYSVAFDGERIASGGLDTTVRIWSASKGSCLALLQGHTALVCQLQLNGRTNTLVTGSADGRIIIFRIAPAFAPDSPVPAASSASDVLVSPPSSPALGGGRSTGSGNASPDQVYRVLTRVSAHSSSVTGLQSDERPGHRWVVSGGNDGRVLLWDLGERARPGSRGEMALVRDLTEPCECLWKVAFRGDVAVICCLRAGRTVVEIWSFRPVEEDL